MSEPTPELWQIAPTLAELRKLPAQQKDRLLLEKFAKMSRRDGSVLNKQNLMLPGDPYGFAQGFPEIERQSVKEHLLGAPWTRLVNEGYLVDLNGQGFHKVTTEGQEFLQQIPMSVPIEAAISSIPVVLPPRIDDVPRVFVSYSWEGDDHKVWVKALAERLQTDGIQIIFDRWHLELGQDKLFFMERAVADSDYVAIVCTEKYADRANKREGGVGWESMVITSEVAEHMHTDKFIPVLRQGTFPTSLPLYLKSRLGVNLMGNPYSEEAYDGLLRKFHGEPTAPPPIGVKPKFNQPPTKPSSPPNNAAEHPIGVLNPAEKMENIEQSTASTLTRSARLLLLAVAADADGRVLVSSTFDGYSVSANRQEFSDNTPRSVAAVKRNLKSLTEHGLLNQLNDQVYEITQEGFERADAEEDLIPLSLQVSLNGPPDHQSLACASTRPINLTRIDLMTTSEATITTIEISGAVVSKALIPIPHSKLIQLWNAPRPGKNGYDHSGPAAIRLVFVAMGVTKDVILQIMMQPALIDNTQWIKLTGSKTFTVS